MPFNVPTYTIHTENARKRPKSGKNAVFRLIPKVMAKNTIKASATYQAKQRKNENNLKALEFITAPANQGKTITELATELNTQGYKTARGGTFRSNQVTRIFELFDIKRK